LVYPVGQHIAIREIYPKDGNDIIFIYNEKEVERITAMNSTKDYSLLLVCEKRLTTACICIYNLHKLNFNSVTIHKPKKKLFQLYIIIYGMFKYFKLIKKIIIE